MISLTLFVSLSVYKLNLVNFEELLAFDVIIQHSTTFVKAYRMCKFRLSVKVSWEVLSLSFLLLILHYSYEYCHFN